MAKAGRKKKIWIADFKEQQKALLEKHARGESLTHEEITYLVAKDGSMPTCREQMMSKMNVCKIEMKAMKKMYAALHAMYPKYTADELKDLFIGVMNDRSYARQTHMPERLDYTYMT